MNVTRPQGRGIPVDDFLQAIAEQLDKAQDALAIKARIGRPLTWALRDFKIALQVFVEVDAQGQVLWRTAGPNETGASTVNLEFTTITKPMIDENSYAMHDDSDARSMDTIGTAAEMSDDEKIRLRRLGVRNVGEFQRAAHNEQQLAKLADQASIPILKLEALRQASARPTVQSHEPIKRGGDRLLRIRGANLSDGLDTEVRLAGEPVEVIEAKPGMLLVRPLEHHTSGQIEVMVKGDRATSFFRLPAEREP